MARPAPPRHAFGPPGRCHYDRLPMANREGFVVLIVKTKCRGFNKELGENDWGSRTVTISYLILFCVYFVSTRLLRGGVRWLLEPR